MTSRLLLTLVCILGVCTDVAAAAPATRPSVLHDLLQLPAPARDWRVHLGWVTEDRVDEPIGANDAIRDDPAAQSADDEAVIAYWFHRASTLASSPSGGLFGGDRTSFSDNRPLISDAQREQLLRAMISRPDNRLTPLVDLLPDTPAAHDQLKKLLDAHPLLAIDGPVDESSYEIDWRWPWQRKVSRWLMHRSRYFRDQLHSAVADLGTTDTAEGRLALEALVKLDLPAARRLSDALLQSSERMVPALTRAKLFRAESAVGGDGKAVETHRAALLAIVENGSEDPAEIAAAALAGTAWPDRTAQEAWVKETLDAGEVHAGMAYGLRRDLKRWQPLVAAQIAQSPAERRPYVVEAYVILLSSAKVDAAMVRPLLPWLKDPDWANGDDDRKTVIRWVAGLDMPETAADMLTLLRDGENAAIAAPAVARYKPPGTVEALRTALSKDDLRHEAFDLILEALISVDGISDGEAAAAIEAHVNDTDPFRGGGGLGAGGLFGGPANRDMKLVFGRALARRGWPGYGERAPATIGMGNGVANRLADLADRRRATEPEFARKVCEVLADWTSPVACRYLVARALAADATAEDIAHVARNAARMRVTAGPELRRALATGGRSGAIAAVVLGDSGVCRRFVETGDREVAALTLAVARLVRTPIDIGVVAGRLAKIPPGAKHAADDELARAAEMYLTAFDTPEARRIVWARHPGEVLILGTDDEGWGSARDGFSGEETTRQRSEMFRELRDEFRGRRRDLAEIHALRHAPGIDESAIRVMPDGSASLTIRHPYGRTLKRALTDAELKAFRSLLREIAIDELPPLYTHVIDGDFYWYLHLTPEGGRKIYMHNPGYATGTPFKKLVDHFEALEDAGGFQITYAASSDAPGLRVIHTQPKYETIQSVWRSGDDLRVLNRYEDQWYSVRGGRPTKVIDAPPARLNPKFWDDIPEPLSIVEPDDLPVKAADGSIVCRALGPIWPKRIWRYKPGEKPVQLTDDGESYLSFAASADGKWLFANHGDGITRVDLTTGKNFDLTLPGGGSHDVFGYNPAHGKFVASRSSDRKTDHFLIDPATGKAEPVAGDFDRLAEAFAAAAQKSSRPNVVWVARPLPEEQDGTEIGLYDLKTFRFETVLRLPMLMLDIHSFWIDEPRREILIAVEYDVIAIPLPKGKLNAS